MNIFRLMTLGVIPLVLGACSTSPSATSMANGNVAISVSTLHEAPLPKPETQQMAEQKCAGSATYLATENLNPFSARHIYRCGAGGSQVTQSYAPATTVQPGASGNVNAGYPAYGSAPTVPAGGASMGHSDMGVSSTDLAPM